MRQMVNTVRAVTGTAHEAWAEPVVAPPRPGDSARVVASADTICTVLGWEARHDVQEMVLSAWAGWKATRGATV